MSKYLFNLTYRSLAIVLIVCVSVVSIHAQADRPIDGNGYNEKYPWLGATGDIQPRVSPSDYADGISIPKLGENFGKANPRVISNKLFSQIGAINAELNLSDYTWVFGQFVDHDIILSTNNSEVIDNIKIPSDDEFFTPGSTMYMQRNAGAPGTGTSIDNPREYANMITAYLDLSNVYGSDEERATWLRTLSNGKLKVSEGNLLPWNTVTGEFNDVKDASAPEMADDTHSLSKMYVAGDVRANENPLLIAFHTLFVREHNRLCGEVKALHPGFNDERIYQGARKLNIAQYQNIVFSEWLPAMGVFLTPYNGYNEEINPQILNEFSTAAFRMGHTLINSTLVRMDDDGDEIKQGNISLRDAFFNPYVVEFAGGIDAYFKGMATQIQQEFDCKVIDDVRNFLFGAPGQGGLDLAAININRGRERGLTDYNSIRVALGLPPLSTFLELTENAQDAAEMEEAYGDINNVDPWTGMLAEPHLADGLFGNMVTTLMEKQFHSLRDGDRFFYRNMDFTIDEMEQIEGTSLRDVLMRNTDISLMQDNVFLAMPHDNIEGGPDLIPFPLEAEIYPNPVRQTLQMKVYSSLDEDVDISVVDYMGKMVTKTTKSLYKGNNTVKVDLTDCPRGYYNVILETERRFKVLKMIKK